MTGIDTNARMLDQARIESEDLPNIDYQQLDVMVVKDLDMRYDAVVGRRILMYLPDPAAALQGVTQVVKPGGYLVLQESDAIYLNRPGDLPYHQHLQAAIW